MVYNQYRTRFASSYSCNLPEILVSLCLSKSCEYFKEVLRKRANYRCRPSEGELSCRRPDLVSCRLLAGSVRRTGTSRPSRPTESCDSAYKKESPCGRK